MKIIMTNRINKYQYVNKYQIVHISFRIFNKFYNRKVFKFLTSKLYYNIYIIAGFDHYLTAQLTRIMRINYGFLIVPRRQ